jgi:hypothetical protein
MFQSILVFATTTLVSGIIDVNKLYDKIYYQFFDNKIISFSKITKTNEKSIPYTQNIYSLWYRILNPFSINFDSFDCSKYLEIHDKDLVIYEIVHNYDKKQHTTIITPSDLKKYLTEKNTDIFNFQMLLKELLIQKKQTENSLVFKFVNKKIMYVGINNKYIVTDTFTRVKHSFVLSPGMTAHMFIDYVLAKNKKIRNTISDHEKWFVTVMDDDFEEHIFKGNNRFL